MLLGSIVLAGGRSRRMGRPKESLPLGGNTLLGRTVEMLMLCTHPVLVVARSDAQELPPLPVESELIYDPTPDQGPLAGMRAGLAWQQQRCDAVLVTGCDMPFLDIAAVSWLASQLDDYDAVIPRVDGLLQPLAAIYATRVLPVVDQMLHEGERSPRALAERVRARILDEGMVDSFDPRRRFLRSINTPEDYELVRRETGE